MSKAPLAVLAAVCTAALIWWAVPGSAKDEPESRAEFSVAGDGELPTSRPDTRDARDPLSTDEVGYAISVATRDPDLPAGAMDVRGEPGWEVLSVDVPDDEVDDGGRRAVVTLYDYAGDSTQVQIVDLSRGRVVKSHAATRLQRPPSVNETQAAVSIALAADPPLAFTADFEASEGVPLVSPEQITSVAGVWTHESADHHGHDQGADNGQECGQQRCVRLIVATPSGRYLGTTDFVVNLSHRSVVRLTEEH
ncbi:hypothetical protein [Mumia sp. DW29H23]|uniref:hypothetical protein n=1 Tax=Mumia sp. DW29H23 TaxID=3421241 RepID=UPI003D691694